MRERCVFDHPKFVDCKSMKIELSDIRLCLLDVRRWLMRGDVSSIPGPFYVISWFPTSVIFRGEFARTEDG